MAEEKPKEAGEARGDRTEQTRIESDEARHTRAEHIRMVLVREGCVDLAVRWLLAFYTSAKLEAEKKNVRRHILSPVPQPKKGKYWKEITRFYIEVVPQIEDKDFPGRVRAEILRLRDAAELHAPPRQPVTPNGRRTEPAISRLVEVMLSNLLKMDRTHYSLDVPLKGEYFGYRRSANQGDIIRYYIRFWNDAGLLRFENYYKRGEREVDSWQSHGFGFATGTTTYLFSHAVSLHQNKGLGLRCFAIRPYRYGWFVGPLLSMDRHEIPIAARTVLIPANQHDGFVPLLDEPTKDERNLHLKNTVLPMISAETIDPKELKDTIYADIENVPYDRARGALEIQSLIWNGTITTLSGHPVFETYTEKEYDALFALHERGKKLARELGSKEEPRNEAFFLRIIDEADKIIKKPGPDYRKDLARIKNRK